MSKQTYLTVENLKAEIIKLGGNERLPKKGSGSGKNGNIIRQDLIKVYNDIRETKKLPKKLIVASPKLKADLPGKDITKLLYTDIWTTVIKSLDIKDIINLCSANKELESKICKNHNYWISRLKEDLNIPNEHVKVEWLEVKSKNETKISPFQTYVFISKNYENVKIAYRKITKWPKRLMGYERAIKKLDCYGNKLTSLPALPNYVTLSCYYNKLTSLPALPKCVKLRCFNNELTSLPALPKCVELYCRDNRLTSLPDLPNCTELYCDNNRLSDLPYLPKLKEFSGENNLAVLNPKLN